ncbi:hypothetical protein GFL43_05750 [Rhizobium laguerreae]|nr:hypothetical protein [Rhizobium laguerreae]
MISNVVDAQNWTERGKTIRDLIKELQAFENPELLAEISIDGGKTTRPISFVGKENGKCLIVYTK